MGAITDTGATNAYTDERIKIARTFGASKLLHSIWQFLSTAIALVVLWLTMRFTLDFGYWLTLALAIPADRRLETSSDK
jgi:fatty acid desaturase